MMLIKLNVKGVRVYMGGGGAPYRPRLDWQNRTGRIANYSRDRSHAYVVWSGNHTRDRVSVALIEPCSFAPDIADSFVGHSSVNQRVRNRAMAHERLQRPGIDPARRQSVPGSMAQRDRSLR
jgi:hypothetical protein